MYDNRPNQGYQKPQAPAFDFAGKPFFTDGKLNLKWVSEYANQLAVLLSKQDLKSSQLRNFYNEFLRIKNMPTSADNEKLVLMKLIVAKVTYKKTTLNISDNYVEFITLLIKAVGEDFNKFNDACHIMEALVAYNPKK